MTEVGAQLRARVAEVGEAVTMAGDRIDPAAAARAREDLARVVERLDLGVDHAVVALVGGTGSGKSSTFNALSRLGFADVGVIRPTTSQAAACVWGPSADRLLDFLGVVPTRRIQRESALTGTDESELRGLVLLDMPDHDSVATGHAELVNRLLPLIDLLVWVVDPQKYADNVLHEGYLRELRERHEAMLVLVNQVDTLTEAGRESIGADVRRLLVEDDLAGVPIIMASARTGLGIDEVRGHLESVLEVESMAARTARDEIGAIVRRVGAGLAAAEPTPAAPADVATSVTDAAGAPAVTTAIETAVAGTGEVALSTVQRPARSRVDAIRDQWLSDAGHGLPTRWRSALTSAVAGADDFYEHVASALTLVERPDSQDRSARVRRLLGLVALWLGVSVLAAGAVVYLLESTTTGVVLAAASLVLLVVGLVLLLGARAARRRTARARAEGYRTSLRDAVTRVVTSDLSDPAAAVLQDHREVRLRLTGSSTG